MPKTHRPGQTQHPLKELVVKERHAHLQGMRHAHAVHFDQDVLRQEAEQVRVQKGLPRIANRRSSEQASQTVFRLSADLLPIFRRVKPAAERTSGGPWPNVPFPLTM